jgi:hypothetical protein
MVKQHRTSPRITAEKLGCHLLVSEALTGAGLMTWDVAVGERLAISKPESEVGSVQAEREQVQTGGVVLPAGAWARF